MTTRRRFGSIRHLPSRRWQARYQTPSGESVTAPHTFAAKLHAEAWLADRKRDIDAKLWNPKARSSTHLLFGLYSVRWLASRQAGGRPLRPRTREHYTTMLDRYLLPAFGDRQLAAITPADVRDWYADNTLTDKPTMRAHCYALLKAIMATALQDELIDANPCRIRGAGQTMRVKKIRPASVHELALLTEAMPERLKLAVPLASWCALRFGEMIELRRGDIDLDAELIVVRRAAVKVKGAPGGHVVGEPKSQAGIRDVGIPPHLVPMIEAHLAEHVAPERDALLFPSKPGGTHHLGIAVLYPWWDKARTEAGRPDLRFHDLRHSGAVLAAATGASLAELMARLGHSTPRAAMRYQHAAQGRDREIAALLSKLAENNM
jgi:integrase